MLTDDKPAIRELAFKKILAARADDESRLRLRVFEVPRIVFTANEYYEMIDWSVCQRYEPPLTKHIDQQLLQNYAAKDTVVPTISFPSFPCHTQAVERCVRLVTEASASVCVEQRVTGLLNRG